MFLKIVRSRFPPPFLFVTHRAKLLELRTGPTTARQCFELDCAELAYRVHVINVDAAFLQVVVVAVSLIAAGSDAVLIGRLLDAVRSRQDPVCSYDRAAAHVTSDDK